MNHIGSVTSEPFEYNIFEDEHSYIVMVVADGGFEPSAMIMKVKFENNVMKILGNAKWEMSIETKQEIINTIEAHEIVKN